MREPSTSRPGLGRPGRRNPVRRRKPASATFVGLTAALAMAAAVAACGSSSTTGTASSATGAASSATGAASGSSRSGSAGSSGIGEIIDVNGPLSDPTFGAIKLGADDAAKAFGVKYVYSAAADEKNIPGDYTTLINEAIARHPAGLVIADFVPATFDPLIKKAVAAGIPVVIQNSGLSSWQPDGAIGFAGTSPPQGGYAGGQAAAKAGVKHLMCVNQVPSNPVLNEYCAGEQKAMVAVGGTSAMLDIPAADADNPAAVTGDIEAYLRSHPDIDGVQALGADVGTDAVDAVKAAGKSHEVKVGSDGVSTAALQQLKSGDLAWLVDPQYYLEGFDAMQMIYQYVKYDEAPAEPVMTGAVAIDRADVARALAVQSKYPGVRGAL